MLGRVWSSISELPCCGLDHVARSWFWFCLLSSEGVKEPRDSPCVVFLHVGKDELEFLTFLSRLSGWFPTWVTTPRQIASPFVLTSSRRDGGYWKGLWRGGILVRVSPTSVWLVVWNQAVDTQREGRPCEDVGRQIRSRLRRNQASSQLHLGLLTQELWKNNLSV